MDDLGRYDEAIHCYNKAIENDPYDADAWNNLGVVYHKVGAYAEAIKSFNRASLSTPSSLSKTLATISTNSSSVYGLK
jgi:tetratricopeptide (TPR) repeat protein